MEEKGKVEAFKDELKRIKDKRVKAWAEWAVSILPDYFFTIPASSTGKYHPDYATGEGGLVRHTKAAVRTAITLLSTDTFGGHYKDIEKDIIIASLLVHDGAKKGVPEGKWTIADHPNIICDYLEKEYGTMVWEDKLKLSESQRNSIYNLIRPHMGQWNTNKDGKEIMPKPKGKRETFVHLCDYIASRKLYEVNFKAQF